MFCGDKLPKAKIYIDGCVANKAVKGLGHAMPNVLATKSGTYAVQKH